MPLQDILNQARNASDARKKAQVALNDARKDLQKSHDEVNKKIQANNAAIEKVKNEVSEVLKETVKNLTRENLQQLSVNHAKLEQTYKDHDNKDLQVQNSSLESQIDQLDVLSSELK